MDTSRGVEYLHGLEIAHRDLKPENILLFGSALLAKIGDLGWCVELTEERPLRQTFCGTMDYLAPEMLTNEPHDTSVDLWALGVLLYEMLIARPPFAAPSQKMTIDAICAAAPEVPQKSMSAGPRELILGLLRREMRERLPLAKVLSHQWVVSLGGSKVPEVRVPDISEIMEVTRVVPRSDVVPSAMLSSSAGSPTVFAEGSNQVGTGVDHTLKLTGTMKDLCGRMNEEIDQLNDSFVGRVTKETDRQRAKLEGIRNFRREGGIEDDDEDEGVPPPGNSSDEEPERSSMRWLPKVVPKTHDTDLLSHVEDSRIPLEELDRNMNARFGIGSEKLHAFRQHAGGFVDSHPRPSRSEASRRDRDPERSNQVQERDHRNRHSKRDAARQSRRRSERDDQRRSKRTEPPQPSGSILDFGVSMFSSFFSFGGEASESPQGSGN